MNFWGTADGSDNHHQGSYGVYMNACVFYKVMTGKSPVGIPVTHAKRIDNGAYRDFTPDTALFMQQYALATVDSVLNAGSTAVVRERPRVWAAAQPLHRDWAVVVPGHTAGSAMPIYTLKGARLQPGHSDAVSPAVTRGW
jgi:hypothetical protein